jgi:hypothetical protein
VGGEYVPSFAENRARALRWCDWQCCLCRTRCGPSIQVVPLDPEGRSDDPDDVIPLCPDCVAKTSESGRDRRSVDELRARREQVFDECTRHLVPPIAFEITQEVRGGGTRAFPDSGFVLRHLGDSLPVKVLVSVTAPEHGEEFRLESPLYTRLRPWRLNPRVTIDRPLEIPVGFRSPQSPLTLEVAVSILDRLDREHPLLPAGFTYVPHGNYWYAEP